MFSDDMIKELKRLHGSHTVAVEIPLDGEGFLDRECPSEACRFRFKVLNAHWDSLLAGGVATCPFCGQRGDPSNFVTQEQHAHVRAMVAHEANRQFDNALRSAARRHNQRETQRLRRDRGRGMLTISSKMEVRSRPPRKPSLPTAWDLMRTVIDCPACTCRYAVVGAAFFCPACGENDADQTFEQSLHRVRSNLQRLDEVTAALDRDTAADFRLQMFETSLLGLVSAFQRAAETLYLRFPTATRPRRNAFQNLEDGSDLWVQAGGRSYDAILGAADHADLTKFFQQRHVLEHREGIVDQGYITRSHDTSYAVGQRLVVKADGVLRFADIIEHLVQELRSDQT